MACRENLQYGPLHIRLSPQADTRRIYTCGDTVRGEVQVERKQKARSLVVHFKATSKMAVAGGANQFVDRASVDLFSLTAELFSFSGEDIDARADDDRTHISFPFEFRFPWVVSTPPPLYEGESFKRSDDFEHLRGHALPPSMRTKCKGYDQAISYHLDAVLTTASLVHPSRRVRHPLTFSPPHPSPPPPPPAPISKTASLSRRTRRLGPLLTARPSSLRARVARLLTGPSPPHPAVTFALTTAAPAVLRAGHAVALTVALTHLARSPSVPHPPPVTLRAFRLELRARTRVRVPYRHNAARELADAAVERAWAVRRDCGGGGGGGAPVFLEDCGVVELGALAGEAGLVVPPGVVPGFRSYGLARAYELEVVVWVQCVGKVYEVEGARHAVEVLPMVCSSEQERVELERAEEERRGEEPPPYELPPYQP